MLKNIKRIIKATIRGCGYVEEYGSHPGTGYIIFFVVLGGISGIDRGGWIGFVLGAAGMAICFGPMYLYGAYDRGK